MVVEVGQLGLAAYILSNGGKLLGVKNRLFTIETDTALDDWRVRYSNSCCVRHDAMVCELRNALRA